ncbi:DUF1775 domain-containing protein [Paenibacillus sp.]|uniref:DUF1775 domain-containing protein n=1 Tax=Paenibacillus sp. TaxID=58172 RepID=UPI0028119B33|nr:DUF1775 domain-containing protein [Paenibacillus sp.]
MSFAVVFLLSIDLFSGIASAHVTVWPKEVEQGAYEKFAVRVPSEEEATPTVKVEVRIPEEATVTRVEPKPGWTYELATGCLRRNSRNSICQLARTYTLVHSGVSHFPYNGRYDGRGTA